MTQKEILALIVFLFLGGCGGQAYEYQDAKEMKAGPGIISGADGKFDLLRSKQDSKDSIEEEGNAAPTTGSGQ